MAIMTDPTSGRYPPSLDQRTLRVAWQQVAKKKRSESVANVQDRSGKCNQCHTFASWLSVRGLCGRCDEWANPAPPQKTAVERIEENREEYRSLVRQIRRLRSGDAITPEEREKIRRLLERLPEAMDDDDTTEPEPVI